MRKKKITHFTQCQNDRVIKILILTDKEVNYSLFEPTSSSTTGEASCPPIAASPSAPLTALPAFLAFSFNLLLTFFSLFLLVHFSFSVSSFCSLSFLLLSLSSSIFFFLCRNTILRFFPGFFLFFS